MPARPKLADPGQLIRGAKRRTDTYDLCTDPDLVAEYEDLLERLVAERAAAKNKDSLDAGGGAAELQQQLDAMQERIEAVTVPLTFQALPRPKWRAFVDAHPPRKNDDGEVTDTRSARIGVDFDPFFTAVLRPSLVSPDLDDETLTYLVEEVLSARQWTDMTTVIWNLNLDRVDVPFSPAVSPRTRNSSRK